MTLKSIKYDIGLKYPEYLPCLNKLKPLIYMTALEHQLNNWEKIQLTLD